MSSQVRYRSNIKQVSHPSRIDNRYVIRAALPQDDEQLTSLIGKIIFTNSISLAFRRDPSYLKATYSVYETPEPMIIENRASGKMMAMFNIGSRRCYINGNIKPLRYLGELRCVHDKELSLVIRLIQDYLSQHLPHDELYQSVFLNDYVLLKEVLLLRQNQGLNYYKTDNALSYTVSGIKNKKICPPNLTLHPLNISDLPDIQRFIKHMAEYYNFLPAYDFNQLVAQTDYWQGLGLDDFFVVRRSDKIVGLFGLWDQQPFRQVRVVEYPRLWVKLRPFYNYWASITRKFRLPRQGKLFKHLVLHSLLSNPYDVSLFDYMVREALQKAHERKFYGISFSLVNNDPRNDCTTDFVCQKIKITHGFSTTNFAALQQTDHKRISYLECGRL